MLNMIRMSQWSRWLWWPVLFILCQWALKKRNQLHVNNFILSRVAHVEEVINNLNPAQYKNCSKWHVIVSYCCAEQSADIEILSDKRHTHRRGLNNVFEGGEPWEEHASRHYRSIPTVVLNGEQMLCGVMNHQQYVSWN